MILNTIGILLFSACAGAAGLQEWVRFRNKRKKEKAWNDYKNSRK